MAGLVLELQRDALNSSIAVADLLRKALVVAKKLGLVEFEKWITFELNGYKRGDETPRYRKVSGEVRVFNPYNGLHIPFLVTEDPKFAAFISSRPVGDAIGRIEGAIKNKTTKGILALPFPKELEIRLMKSMEFPMRPMLYLGESELHGIVDAVRNTVLEWAINLERDGIIGEGMTFSPDERRAAASTVYNIQNYIGTMNRSQVQQGTCDSSQAMTMGLDVSAVVSILKELSKALRSADVPADIKKEIEADVQSIKSQLRSPNPKPSIVKECLRSIRSILEQAAGSVIAGGIPALLDRINALVA